MSKVKHLGIIPDGNRRWSFRNKTDIGLTYFKSYRVLYKIIIELFDKNSDLNEISIFILSYDNLINRSKSELNLLFKLANRIINTEIIKYQKKGFMINWVGLNDILKLEFDQGLYEKMIHSLSNNPGVEHRGIINVIVGYSPERDIIENYSYEDKSLSNLEVKSSVDCIIRTGGKSRLSGFLPFHSKYSSLYFIDKFIPDLTYNDVIEIIKQEELEDQNFGK